MVRAGKMRARITIERNTPSQDGFGEMDPSWATLVTVWAEKEPLQGREAFGSDLQYSERPTVFRIRYASSIADLSVRDRVVDGSTVYDLVSVINVGDRNEAFELVGVVRE